MKNTLMFLLASLLLAFSLTACGGGGQTTGTADNGGTADDYGTANNGGAVDDYGTADNGGTAGQAGNGVDGSMDGEGGLSGGYDNGGSLMDDARDAVDDAGRSVRNAVDGAGDAIDRAF
ncbi:MAG: hypothetical protein K2L38_10055 [Dysosmobacter sp.]|nr:hypothetical protein [Dysosmobacter sp.]